PMRFGGRAKWIVGRWRSNARLAAGEAERGRPGLAADQLEYREPAPAVGRELDEPEASRAGRGAGSREIRLVSAGIWPPWAPAAPGRRAAAAERVAAVLMARPAPSGQCPDQPRRRGTERGGSRDGRGRRQPAPTRVRGPTAELTTR